MYSIRPCLEFISYSHWCNGSILDFDWLNKSFKKSKWSRLLFSYCKRYYWRFSCFFIDIIIVVYLFGVFVQYQVIIYTLLGRTIYEFFGDKDKYENIDSYEDGYWDSSKLKFPIMFGTTLLVMSLCLLKDISKMRFASMFGICALIYCIL